MQIIFEEHQYEVAKVQKTLEGITTLQDVEQKISVGYVGYYYNPTIEDCVFILPKVLLTDKNKREVLANVKSKETGEDILPEDIITPDGQDKHLPKDYRKFLYEFAVWIYRSLCVYRKLNEKSKAIYYRQLPQEGKGRRRETNTYLDIVLSLIRFNRENQNFFLFTIKNLHSGLNKINWAKTISRSQTLVQQSEVLYLNPVNKKRQVNYEEELFIIFFSILNYLNDAYGFRTPINCNYELIKGKQFEAYRNGMGKTRLRQIRYKYFSDKTLQLWDLCFAFFDASHRIAVNTDQREYLLAKSFEHVFEAMIDELIGEKNPPRGLKEQADGKRVDHMYTYYGLTHGDDQDDEIYYIGDSKYYKSGHPLGHESVYKQYTYARNVIQWNIDLFMKGQHEGWTEEEREAYLQDKEEYGKIRLRDDQQDPLTEGYNVIPNFFISAFVDKERRYIASKNIEGHPFRKNGEVVRDGNGEIVPQTYTSFQFEDRLFDRDTLILSHYDVNFLYVLYLYARNKQNEKAAWRTEVREIFRREIRRVLQERFDFYALMSKGNVLAGEQFIKDYYKELQGKLYRPYGDRNLYALALEKHEGTATQESEAYRLLSEFFEIKSVTLGENPKEPLKRQVERYQKEHPYASVPENWLPDYHVERYLDDYFVVGLYHDQAHWDWITGKNDRGSLIYNVRLDPERQGSMPKSRIRRMRPKFAILYEEGHEDKYHVFRIHDYAEMTEDRMRQALYPREPKGNYFVFRFDEEVSIGRFDIQRLISTRRIFDKDFVEGMPLYPQGKELMGYRI
jgi:hypothetical protein